MLVCRPFGELESLAYKNDSKVAWQERLEQSGLKGAAVPRPPSHVKPGTTVRNAGSLETISQVTWSMAWSSWTLLLEVVPINCSQDRSFSISLTSR